MGRFVLLLLSLLTIAASEDCPYHEVAAGVTLTKSMYQDISYRLVITRSSICEDYCTNGYFIDYCDGFSVEPRRMGYNCYLFQGLNEANVQSGSNDMVLYARRCPVDCVPGEWSSWSSCSETCGDGVQTISRTPAVEAAYDGVDCTNMTYSRSCNEGHCPVDCVVGSWSDWSACPCGGGEQTREREELVAAAYNGTECPDLSESMSCTNDCVNCTEVACCGDPMDLVSAGVSDHGADGSLVQSASATPIYTDQNNQHPPGASGYIICNDTCSNLGGDGYCWGTWYINATERVSMTMDQDGNALADAMEITCDSSGNWQVGTSLTGKEASWEVFESIVTDYGGTTIDSASCWSSIS